MIFSSTFEVKNKKIQGLYDAYLKEEKRVFRLARKICREMGGDPERILMQRNSVQCRVIGITFPLKPKPTGWVSAGERGFYRPHKKSELWETWLTLRTKDYGKDLRESVNADHFIFSDCKTKFAWTTFAYHPKSKKLWIKVPETLAKPYKPVKGLRRVTEKKFIKDFSK
jgi:hypothetical protein